MGWDIAGRIRSRRKTSGQDTSSRAAQASRGLVILLLLLLFFLQQQDKPLPGLLTTDEANLFIQYA